MALGFQTSGRPSSARMSLLSLSAVFELQPDSTNFTIIQSLYPLTRVFAASLILIKSLEKLANTPLGIVSKPMQLRLVARTVHTRDRRRMVMQPQNDGARLAYEFRTNLHSMQHIRGVSIEDNWHAIEVRWKLEGPCQASNLAKIDTQAYRK